MSVFISYQRADESTAKTVADLLTLADIKFYLDVLDPDIPAENVTRVILAGLAKCSHLLAVVSQATRESWWVPFEIGVATNAQKRIATYSSPTVALPAFLTVWPVLNGTYAMAKFVALYRDDKIVLEESGNLRKAASTNAAEFHSALKRSLGQP
jgi:hypothetical protein